MCKYSIKSLKWMKSFQNSINFFLFNLATCLRCKICLGKLEIINFCNFDGVSLDDAFKLLVLDKQPSGTK